MLEMWSDPGRAGLSRGTGMSGSRPISRVLSWTIIHLGPPSPVASSNLPESTAGHGITFLFGLAPGGVYHAAVVANCAVRSYRTISPLPVSWRYIFCCTFRRLAPPRSYLAPCPVEPGLSSPFQTKRPVRSDCLAGSRVYFPSPAHIIIGRRTVYGVKRHEPWLLHAQPGWLASTPAGPLPTPGHRQIPHRHLVNNP
jgi:hypothetical protein